MVGNESSSWDQVIAAFTQKTDRLKAVIPEVQAYSVSVTKSYAPVKTGRLQEEITGEMQGEYSFKLESPTEYAAYVNYGTSKMKPNPYFDRGVLDTMTKFIEDLKNALK
jgi:HK97 gp10 family phage protein